MRGTLALLSCPSPLPSCSAIQAYRAQGSHRVSLDVAKLGGQSTVYCKLLADVKHHGEVLLHPGPILQGPVSSGMLPGHVNSGDVGCQDLLSCRMGRGGHALQNLV